LIAYWPASDAMLAFVVKPRVPVVALCSALAGHEAADDAGQRRDLETGRLRDRRGHVAQRGGRDVGGGDQGSAADQVVACVGPAEAEAADQYALAATDVLAREARARRAGDRHDVAAERGDPAVPLIVALVVPS
jgi:hypothetical protein